MIIYAYLITYNIHLCWMDITRYKYATSYFQLYFPFFHYNDAKACNYLLKFLVFLSM